MRSCSTAPPGKRRSCRHGPDETGTPIERESRSDPATTSVSSPAGARSALSKLFLRQKKNEKTSGDGRAGLVDAPLPAAGRPPPSPPPPPLLPSPDQGPAVGPGRGVSPPLLLPRARRTPPYYTLHVPEDHGVVAILAGLRAVPRRRHHLRRSVRPRRHSRPAEPPTGRRTLPFVMKSSNEVNLGCHPVRSRVRLQSPGPLPTGAPSPRSPVNVHSQAVPSTPEARVASIMRSRAMGSAPSHPRNTSPRNAAPPCSGGGAGARRQRPKGGKGGTGGRVGEAPAPPPEAEPTSRMAWHRSAASS